MGRWKRHGVIVVLYSTDHDPKHVHVFEDRKRILKFNLFGANSPQLAA